MTRVCEFCADDTEGDGEFYLESEAPDGGVNTVERIGGYLCHEHARAVREALVLLDDNRTSEATHEC